VTSRYSVKFFAPCKAKGFQDLFTLIVRQILLLKRWVRSTLCRDTQFRAWPAHTHIQSAKLNNKGPNKETSQLTLFYYYIYMYEQICLFFLRYFYNFRAKIQAVPVFFLMATGFWLLLLLVQSAHGPNFYFQFKQLKAEREREKKKPFNCGGYSCWWWWCNFLFDSLYCLVAAGFIS
jgi:hypothetical protein